MSINELDYILDYLKTDSGIAKSYYQIREHYNKHTLGGEFEDVKLFLILKKLCKDEFVEEFTNPITYRITYDGLTFVGYEHQAQVQKSQDKLKADFHELQKDNVTWSRRLVYLTVILALGTGIAALYYGLEIYKWFYPSY